VEKRVVFLACLSHFLMHLLELLFAQLYGMKTAAMRSILEESLGVDGLRGTLAVGLYFALMGVGGVAGGLAADRWSIRGMLAAWLGGAAVACAALGFAARSFTVFGISLVALGFFLSFHHPVALALLSFQKERRGTALGIHGIAGGLGVAAAPLAGVYLASGADPWSWQRPYAVLAVVLAVAAIGAALTPMRVERHDERPAKIRENALSIDALTPLFILFACMAANGFVYRNVGTNLQHYFQTFVFDEVLFPGPAWPAEKLIAWIATAYGVAGGIGQFVLGRLSDWIDPLKLYRWSFIGVAVALALLGAVGTGVAWPLFAFGPLGFFLLALQPLENGLIPRYTPAKHRSFFYSLKFIFGYGIAGGAPALSALVESRFGTPLIFTAFLPFALLAAILTSFGLHTPEEAGEGEETAAAAGAEADAAKDAKKAGKGGGKGRKKRR